MLIPKIVNANQLTHFRPICLCNVAYKIIAKLLVHRLHLLLPSLISPNQSAFIKGRRATNNIIIGKEIINLMSNRTKTVGCGQIGHHPGL